MSDNLINELNTLSAEFKGAIERADNAATERLNNAISGVEEKLRNLAADANRPGSDADAEAEFKDFRNFLATRDVKSMSAGSQTDGGVTIPKTIHGQILSYLHENTVMRQIASVQSISTPDYNYPVQVSGAGAEWTGETDARNTTATPTIQNVKPPVGELTARALITQTILEDSQFDLQPWLVNSLGEKFDEMTGNAFMTGDGTNKPKGLLSYLLGWRVNGKLMWGMGIPASRINFDNFRVYANVCEERVQLAGGGTQQRYFCDGIFSTADTHESVIATISASMGSCKLSDVGGVYGFIGGYDDTLGPKQALDDDDLVAAVGSASPYSWVPAGPTRETYNNVRGRYADPTQQYQLIDWGVIESDPLPDGVNRTLTLDLGCVSDPKAAQRIAKQFMAREALTPGYFQATFGPRAFAVNVGSLVTLSINSLGWNNKLFRVMEQREVHNMLYTMTLREESPEVYAWDKEEKALPANIRPAGFDPAFTITPTGLSLSSTTYESV